MNSKILVTGFEPFLASPVNPSSMLLEILAPEFPQIETLLLPVSYKNSPRLLKEQWQTRGPYRALLMLGQAARRSAVCIERVALNWSESAHADNDQVILPPGPLVPGGPAAVVADFFPTSWKEILSAEGPAEISYTAGTYVCNSLYFHALTEICSDGTPALFAHVPLLPEQAARQPGMPSMSLESQTKVIRRLIQLMDEFTG